MTLRNNPHGDTLVATSGLVPNDLLRGVAWMRKGMLDGFYRAPYRAEYETVDAVAQISYENGRLWATGLRTIMPDYKFAWPKVTYYPEQFGMLCRKVAQRIGMCSPGRKLLPIRSASYQVKTAGYTGRKGLPRAVPTYCDNDKQL